jgi:hypothetical protein
MENVTLTSHDHASHGEYHAHVPGSNLIGRLTWVTREGAGRRAHAGPAGTGRTRDCGKAG